MDNCDPKFPCCPPETANVVQVQNVAGIKGLNNCFVYVQSINTSFYVDNAHRITWISAGVVEEPNYDIQANPLNLRNQFLYDPRTKEVHYFSNTGYDATFASTVSLEDLQALEQKITANTTEINNLNTSLNQTNLNLADEVSSREEADSSLKSLISAYYNMLEGDLTKLELTSVQRDTDISGDESTITITKTVGELESEGEATAMPLPVASETSAGVVNSATYQAIQNNSENVDAILNGAIALENLSATITQEELTNVWEEATGKTTLINRASIYDITNNKVWYYYANIGEWKPLSTTAEGEVNVSIFTNETAGIIKGSDNDGQLFAEANGTGSVVGWDIVKADIVNLQSEVERLEIPKLPASMVYDFVSPAGTNNPSTADNANITVRVVNTSTGVTNNSVLMMPMASSTQAGSITASNKSKLDALPAITSIGSNLELTDDGVLNATGGGGGSITLYDEYSTDTNGANSAAFIDNKLNNLSVYIGSNSYSRPNAVGIGYNASGSGLFSTALGPSAYAGGVFSVALGYGAKVEIPDYERAISIGNSAQCKNTNSIAIGASALAEAPYSIAIGSGTNVYKTYDESVALGHGSHAQKANSVSIGSGLDNWSGPKTRFLSCVTAGVADTDAVNVAQLNALNNSLQETLDELLTELNSLTQRINALEQKG